MWTTLRQAEKLQVPQREPRRAPARDLGLLLPVLMETPSEQEQLWGGRIPTPQISQQLGGAANATKILPAV